MFVFWARQCCGKTSLHWVHFWFETRPTAFLSRKFVCFAKYVKSMILAQIMGQFLCAQSDISIQTSFARIAKTWRKVCRMWVTIELYLISKKKKKNYRQKYFSTTRNIFYRCFSCIIKTFVPHVMYKSWLSINKLTYGFRSNNKISNSSSSLESGLDSECDVNTWKYGACVQYI